MINYKDYITIEPGKRSGQPCIRDLRITVGDILSMLASDVSYDNILSDHPQLSKNDILAALSFAADYQNNSQKIILPA